MPAWLPASGRCWRARLDQALGAQDEPISPLEPIPDLAVRMSFAEPLGRPEDIDAACRRLLGILAERLTAAGLGVRRLAVGFGRLGGRQDEG